MTGGFWGVSSWGAGVILLTRQHAPLSDNPDPHDIRITTWSRAPLGGLSRDKLTRGTGPLARGAKFHWLYGLSRRRSACPAVRR
jgi:hypothetical protein